MTIHGGGVDDNFEKNKLTVEMDINEDIRKIIFTLHDCCFEQLILDWMYTNSHLPRLKSINITRHIH